MASVVCPAEELRQVSDADRTGDEELVDVCLLSVTEPDAAFGKPIQEAVEGVQVCAGVSDRALGEVAACGAGSES